MRLDRRLLGWGTFFILLGVIPLAVRFDYLDENLIDGWPALWPLLLVGWGLGLLLRRTPVDWVGGALTTIVFGIMGGGLIATGVGGVSIATGCGDQGGTAFQQRTGTLADGGNLSVELPCGQLTMTAAGGSDWSVSGSDEDGKGPDIETGDGSVTIRDNDRFGASFFDTRTTWDVTVPRDVADLGISLTVNAGKGDLDFSGAQLDSLSFTLNAGDLSADLSTAASLSSVSGTINAGSTKLALPDLDSRLSLTINAGSLDLCVPSAAGVRVQISTTLGSHNLDALGLTKVGDDTWQSQNFGSAATRIDVNATANVGSFTLKIGGGCGA
jgi:hypothetical protein